MPNHLTNAIPLAPCPNHIMGTRWQTLQTKERVWSIMGMDSKFLEKQVFYT